MDYYAIITENDESSWDDITGIRYHFPKRYLKIIPPGAKVIYYKGKIQNKGFSNQWLSDQPHYFGIAVIDNVIPDENNYKGDLFTELKDFIPFENPVLIYDDSISSNRYLETTADTISNYWRDGVRKITKAVYDSILSLADFNLNDSQKIQTPDQYETQFEEGGKKVRYGSYYERNPRLRKEALKIHGYSCQVCGINFEKVYGEMGSKFIHVHHKKPISLAGKSIVNPKTDLCVVCPNCHSMIHRKQNIIDLEELKSLMNAVPKET